MNTKPALALGFLFVACAPMIACGGDKTPPKTPQPADTSITSTQPQKPAPVTNGINVSQDIRDACQLSQIQSTNESPKFDFDSSDVTADEKPILDQIAKCLTTGPLKGRSVQLVGRADPRGETEYNMTLGHHRADSVRRYLSSSGVADNKMNETSRGALDASGTDEASWKVDRRVDIKLQ